MATTRAGAGCHPERHRNRSGIPVENPATGEIDRDRPDARRPTRSRRSSRARATRSRPGRRSASRSAAKVFLRAQKWITDNAERIIETIVSETGKTYEDAQLAEVMYAANAFGFWAKKAPEYLADEQRQVGNPFVKGKKLDRALPPRRRRRRDRPVELPADELLRRLHPGAGGRQRRRPQAARGHAAHLAADGGGAARVRHARATSSRSRPATAQTGAALIDEVDFIMFTGSTKTGKKVMAARGADAHARRPRARRQGPDDRAAPTPTSSAPPTPPRTTR